MGKAHFAPSSWLPTDFRLLMGVGGVALGQVAQQDSAFHHPHTRHASALHKFSSHQRVLAVLVLSQMYRQNKGYNLILSGHNSLQDYTGVLHYGHTSLVLRKKPSNARQASIDVLVQCPEEAGPF